MDNSKIPGLYYFEYLHKDTGKRTVIPNKPPSTTWNGLLLVDPDSEYAPGLKYADRLKNKCGGLPYAEATLSDNIKSFVDKSGDAMNGWIIGFWTAPTDWPEMSAGRESSKPFSPDTYSVKDFPFLVARA